MINGNSFIISEEEAKICKLCEPKNIFKTHRNLIEHIKKVHNMNFEKYIINVYYSGKHPVCKCEKCKNNGVKLKFKPFKCGPWFKNYAKNHWPHKKHTKETKEKIRKTLKKLYNGETKLKKKIRNSIISIVDKIHSKENSEKRIKLCKNFWKDIEKSKKERKRRSEYLIKKWKSGNGPNKLIGKYVEKIKRNDPKKYELWRKKVSISTTKRQMKHGVNLQHTIKCKAKNPFNNEFDFFDSSWELLFARWCYSVNIEYKKNKEITIPYINSKGNFATYVPDFILPRTREIVEIKGYKDENADNKKNAAIKWCKKNNFTYFYLQNKELESIIGFSFLKKQEIKRKINHIISTNSDTISFL